MTANDWNPNLHPRDSEGQFAETPGGGGVSEVGEKIRDAVSGGDRVTVKSTVSESTGVTDVELPTGMSDDQFATFASTLARAGELGLTDEVERITTHASDEAGLYRFNDGTLSFNRNLSEGDHLDYEAGDEAVGNTVEWLVMHELGHAEHNGTVEDMVGSEEFFDRNLAVGRDGEWVGRERVNLVDDEVSAYARTNPAEFVAEVYSGLATGKEFSTEVMKIYEEFDGPTSWKKFRRGQE